MNGVVQGHFDHVQVQLAKLTEVVPEGDDWVYELKYDGYRMVAFVEGNSVRLVSRNGNDYTKRFAQVATSLEIIGDGKTMVLDGEIVVLDRFGKTDFQALQDYGRNPTGKKLVYIIFDLLALGGQDLRQEPLLYRKEKLEVLMQGCPHNLHYSRHVQGMGRDSFTAACQAGMEGIVGKKANSIYQGGKNDDWIKLKCIKRQEFVIGGYTLTEKRGMGVSALLLGVYEGEQLVYAGRAGTGMSQEEQRMLSGLFASIIREESPFTQEPEHKANEKIFWLEPTLVVEIKYVEWTREGLLRQASYQGLRMDKEAREVFREDAAIEKLLEKSSDEEKESARKEEGSDIVKMDHNMIAAGVPITSPDKVLFEEPLVTKEDVVRYYAAVSERMLPYMQERILTVVRCPRGIAKDCFYKKHPQGDTRGIVRIPVKHRDGRVEDYFYITDATGLMEEVQMGTLEFHTWGSSVKHLEQPDIMVFDLDPDEGMELAQVRQGVRDLKEILTELSLVSYLKTSGGKGYHIVLPLYPSVTWETFHDFAKGVAQVMEQKWPSRYTSNVRKSNRTNRIFIDWIRNGRGATSVAPYSIRARKGANVSMPISWEELDLIAPDGIGMSEAIRRMSHADPWSGFFEHAQRLIMEIK